MIAQAKPILLGLFLASAWGLAHAANDRPVALVEEIDNAPNADVERFQYVYDGDKIDLREAGVVTLAYFETCEVVTVTGGVAKVKADGVDVSKGGDAQVSVRPCQTSSLALNDEAREAGAAVKRVSPFMGDDWREISVATAHPIFLWPNGGDADYAIAVFYLDEDPVREVWQAGFANGLVYPEDAPSLEAGMPYEVVITRNGKKQASAVFSIDPALELPDAPLNSAIPLGL